MLSAIEFQRNFQKWGAAYNSSQNLNYKKSYIEVKRILDSLIKKNVMILRILLSDLDATEITLGSKVVMYKSKLWGLN